MSTRRTRSAVHRQILTATTTAAVLTAVLTGCTQDAKDTGDGAPPKPSAPASAATASPSASVDPLAADKAEVQAAYDRYWQVLVAAYAKSDSKGTDLKKVSTADAYVQTENGLAGLRDAGQVIVGSPSIRRPQSPSSKATSSRRPSSPIALTSPIGSRSTRRPARRSLCPRNASSATSPR